MAYCCLKWTHQSLPLSLPSFPCFLFMHRIKAEWSAFSIASCLCGEFIQRFHVQTALSQKMSRKDTQNFHMLFGKVICSVNFFSWQHSYNEKASLEIFLKKPECKDTKFEQLCAEAISAVNTLETHNTPFTATAVGCIFALKSYWCKAALSESSHKYSSKAAYWYFI